MVTIAYESTTSSRVVSVSQANTTTGSPGASVTRFAYPDASTRFVAQGNTDQASAVAAVPHITYAINSSTNLVNASTDEMGRQQAATYTPNGDVATATNGAGATAGTTTGTYGANGGDSMTSLKAPGGATQTATYGNTAAATAYLASSSTDSAGNSSTYTYNGAGNPTGRETIFATCGGSVFTLVVSAVGLQVSIFGGGAVSIASGGAATPVAWLGLSASYIGIISSLAGVSDNCGA